MKRFAHVSVYVLVIILMLAKTGAAEAALSDCIDATCRITAADGSRGTGCVFEISRDRVYVLTAAHVVGKNQLVHCEFWQKGHRSRPLQARVIARVENDRCDAAVVALASSQFGGRLPWLVVIGVVLACTCYSLSDLSIEWLIRRTLPGTVIRASMIGVCLTYILCGVVALAMLPIVGFSVLKDWRWALPFAACWWLAMLFLFATFGQIGVVFGVILQSTRGLMSVAVGPLVAGMGLTHVERALSREVIVRRLLAAAMMTAAVAAMCVL